MAPNNFTASPLFMAVADRVLTAAVRGGELFSNEIFETIRTRTDGGCYESPIEVVFAAWWDAIAPRSLCLCPQYEVELNDERFRLDFTIQMDAHPGSYGSNVFTPYPKICIELDGHDFHERTKEQVTLRNRRDRLLQGSGWKVFHVSGSEMWRSPDTCVDELIRLIGGEMSAFWCAYWADVSKSKTAALNDGQAV